ncbi:MAG: DUF2489 domain-containing protein [Moritella sp.]|uniref:DUF2489 domain-containing protein n=1 Tax=Moritella sp. TaxID=78556 RepID=UPI0025D995F7|nr:DUF2489 domain-containing protein [Moritella sp.]NQZ94056.1 DUF2489 domain-containing protein [Moritella sp.]
MQASWMILIGTGCLIILALSMYAGRLLYRVKAKQEQQLNQQNEAIAARKVRITESVQIIAKAMGREECDLSEGAIRISKLLAAIPAAEPVDWAQQYPDLHAFYDKIKHMPIMDARSELSKKTRMQFDLDRFRFEGEYADRVQQDVARLTTFEC